MTLNKIQIESKIRTIAIQIFGFELVNYLSNKNKKIVGLKYTTKNKVTICEPFFFSSDNNAIKFIQIIDIISGKNGFVASYYSTSERLKKVSKDFNRSNTSYNIIYKGNFDFFAINSILLKEKEENVDLILIHEMCHMLVDSKYLKKIELRPSKIDKNRGDVLLDSFSLIGDSITHNAKFCNLLAAAVRKHDEQKVNNNLWSAVKYNFACNPDLRKRDIVNTLKKIDNKKS